MTSKPVTSNAGRRQFLGSVMTGAAAAGIATLTPFQSLKAEEKRVSVPNDDDPDAWFGKIKGKHRIIYDVPHPNEIFPFAWPRVFLLTNEKTGTPASACSVVVVLRHTAIAYAFGHSTWEKYKFGNLFGIKDAGTKAPAIRNAFWQPGPDDFKIPGIGSVDIGINSLQSSGVMFCVCDMAMTVFSATAAASMNMDAAEVKKDWMSGLLPGIQPVPAGVWAVGRAQEHGCSYCYCG